MPHILFSSIAIGTVLMAQILEEFPSGAEKISFIGFLLWYAWYQTKKENGTLNKLMEISRSTADTLETVAKIQRYNLKLIKQIKDKQYGVDIGSGGTSPPESAQGQRGNQGLLQTRKGSG